MSTTNPLVLWVGTLLVIKLMLVPVFTYAHDAEHEGSHHQRAKRALARTWLTRRHVRGIDTGSSSFSAAWPDEDDSFYEDEGRHSQMRRVPPFPRYGRDLEEAHQGSPRDDLLPSLYDMHMSWVVPIQFKPSKTSGRFKRSTGARKAGSNPSWSLDDKAGASTRPRYSQWSGPYRPFLPKALQVSMEGDGDSAVGQARPGKAVPAPRIGRGEGVGLNHLRLEGSVRPAGRRGLRLGAVTHAGQASPDPVRAPGPHEADSGLRLEKAVPAPRIGKREGKGLFVSVENSREQDSGPQEGSQLSRAMKAVPAPRIGRSLDTKPSSRSKRAVPSPRVGREELEQFLRILRAVPVPRIGRRTENGWIRTSTVPTASGTDLFSRVAKAVPVPRIGRQVFDIHSRAVPAPRIGRQESENYFGTLETVNGSPAVEEFPSLVRAAPTPGIGRQDSVLSMVPVNVPGPQKSLYDLAEISRERKTVTAPRMGRRGFFQSPNKVSITPSVGLAKLGPMFRASRAVPYPRIGRQEGAVLMKPARTVTAPRVGRQDALARTLKAVPVPRIGKREGYLFTRYEKAVPVPRIGRRDFDLLSRVIKAVPVPRIGRREFAAVSRTEKAPSVPRIGHEAWGDGPEPVTTITDGGQGEEALSGPAKPASVPTLGD